MVPATMATEARAPSALTAKPSDAVEISVAETLADDRTQELIVRLRERGLRMELSAEEAGPTTGPLVGKTFVITGTLPNLSREEATSRGALFAPSSGEAAQKAVFPAVQANAWLLFDSGKAKVSPATVGIPKI